LTHLGFLHQGKSRQLTEIKSLQWNTSVQPTLVAVEC
jgi:hypothetical protein